MYSYHDEQSDTDTETDEDFCNCNSQERIGCSNILRYQKSYAIGKTDYQDFNEDQSKMNGCLWLWMLN